MSPMFPRATISYTPSPGSEVCFVSGGTAAGRINEVPITGTFMIVSYVQHSLDKRHCQHNFVVGRRRYNLKTLPCQSVSRETGQNTRFAKERAKRGLRLVAHAGGGLST